VRDKTFKRLLLVLCALVVVAFVISLESYRFKRIQKDGAMEISPVAATIPATPSFVSAAVRNMFNSWDDFVRADSSDKFRNRFPADSKWSGFYLTRKGDSAAGNLFPQDESILLDRGNDRFVRRYVDIPASLRANDLYLYEPTGDEYWLSEYRYRGQPAKFRCSFFIHIEPVGSASTRLEIFEYQPEIWVGERYGFSAHAVLPVMFHDIRFVEPTTIDRLELLSLVLKSLVV
jgi:hypothetical protein